MAQQTQQKLNILSDVQRKELESLGSKIERSKQALNTLKELGLGVSDLEARIEWAEKRRKILLEKG
jgi:hypothetical protein